jgi:hypothetical protein
MPKQYGTLDILQALHRWLARPGPVGKPTLLQSEVDGRTTDTVILRSYDFYYTKLDAIE